MKKILLAILGLLFILSVSACIDGTVQPPINGGVVVTAIEINESTLADTYAINQLDLTSIMLIVYYSDETTESIPLEIGYIQVDYRPLLSQLGTHLIVVFYEQEMTTFTLTLTEAVADDGAIVLNFYYLNDLHGALLPAGDEMGMAYVGNFLKDEKQNNPESTIILAGGDMLQGKLISNLYHGGSTVEIMDMIGFDAAVVGNHEFDWGIEMVTRYYLDVVEEDVYEAQHPFLAANIVYEGTTTIPAGMQPYTIIERSGLKIGIIGTIGYGLESSIAAYRAEGYQFLDPVPIVRYYASYLRTEENVDVVVLLTHDSGHSLNNQVAYFEGNERIDAVFNGHSHSTANAIINGMPTIISSSEGKRVGHIQLVILDGEIIDVSSQNYGRNDDARFLTPDSLIQAYLDSLMDELAPYYEVLMTSKAYYSREALTFWKARLILEATGADFAFHNSGGTRATLYQGQEISLAEMENIFPFDNAIITTVVSGSVVLDMLNNTFQESATHFEGTVDPEALYTVATNSFIFYSQYNTALQEGDNITIRYDNVILVMFEEILLQAEVFTEFDVYGPILIGTLPEYGSYSETYAWID